MITYQMEKLADCLDEMKPLLEAHWKEIAIDRDKIKLNPDYARYLKMEEEGIVHTATVRDGKLLIGYFVSFVVPNLHYSDHLWALNDILFLAPGYRGDYETAANLFKFAESHLKTLGVSVIQLHMKNKYSFDSLALYCGYNKVESGWSKYIKD